MTLKQPMAFPANNPPYQTLTTEHTSHRAHKPTAPKLTTVVPLW